MALPSPFRKDDPADDLQLFPGHASTAWGGVSEDARLSVDVHETGKEIVVRSAIAGVRPQDIDVSVHGDMLTIRGERHEDRVDGAKALLRECHWGAFSRSVILPHEVDPDGVSAAIKDGVLTVRLPKSDRSRRISVKRH